MKKITLATIKAFIAKNRGHLWIKNLSNFDPMTDCVQECNGGFRMAGPGKHDNDLGVGGAWFVGHGSRDYFNAYDNGEFVGYEVGNACGNFVIATTK